MITRIDLNYKKDSKNNLLEFILSIMISSFVLLMASTLFKGFYVSSLWYAIIASLIIYVLNKTIKPFLILLTLPVTIYTVGLFYPFVNVIILKITSFFLGSAFEIHGFFIPFFVALFISFMNILLGILIIKPIAKEG